MIRRFPILISLVAVAVSLGTAAPASAGIRVDARVRTPNVDIRVGNYPGPQVHPRYEGPRPHHERVRHYRLGRRDRQVAQRLAWWSGVPRRVLLAERADGWQWKQIGRWYDIHPRVVRAARNHRSWQHFVERHDYAHHGKRGRGHHRGGVSWAAGHIGCKY